VVTVPVEQPGQSLARSTFDDRSARPAALRTATMLLLFSTLPFLLVGGAAAGAPMQRWLPYTGPWPRVHTGQTGYRVLGACVLLLAVVHLLLAAQAYRRRLWARTAVVALTAVYDMTLTLVLLADEPRPGWLVTGAAVVLCSLAAVVCGYQPEVDRYLADESRHAY
jgi:drug/metabolite transporter (DMT)-like permease